MSDIKPVLKRLAKCTSCKTEKPSSKDLWFFKEKSDEAKDEFYCGCLDKGPYGWD